MIEQPIPDEYNFDAFSQLTVHHQTILLTLNVFPRGIGIDNFIIKMLENDPKIREHLEYLYKTGWIVFDEDSKRIMINNPQIRETLQEVAQILSKNQNEE